MGLLVVTHLGAVAETADKQVWPSVSQAKLNFNRLISSSELYMFSSCPKYLFAILLMTGTSVYITRLVMSIY